MGQKIIEIPKNDMVEWFIEKLPEYLANYNLNDLRISSDSLNIRIWERHEILTLKLSDSIHCNYKIHTITGKPIVYSTDYSEGISGKLLDSLISLNIMDLQDENYKGIDGSFIFFEISTPKTYRIVSYWSPDSKRSENCRSVVRILNTINKILDIDKVSLKFFNSLEPGNYGWGMSFISVDRFLNCSIQKTDFYPYAESRIREELNITDSTNHRDFPLIIINNKPAMISSLNLYSKKDVVSFDILKPEDPLIGISGTRTSHGVVRLITK